MIAVTVPSWVDGQTIITLPDPITVPDGRKMVPTGWWAERICTCGYDGGGSHNHDGTPCKPNMVPYRGHIAIVVPCEACAGKGYDTSRVRRVSNDDQGTATYADCPDCDGSGHLLVATATVVDCVPVTGVNFPRCMWDVHLEDVQAANAVPLKEGEA